MLTTTIEIIQELSKWRTSQNRKSKEQWDPNAYITPHQEPTKTPTK